MRSCGPTAFNLPPQGRPGVAGPPGASGDYGAIRGTIGFSLSALISLSQTVNWRVTSPR